MNYDDTKQFLIKICNATSVSGYENEVAKVIKEKFSEYCDETSIDNFGNVIGIKNGKGKGKIMFAAHMDEIGLMVSNIDSRGFVKFTNIGGYDQRTLLSQEVIIHGKEKVYGVIGLKPPHLSTEADMEKAVPMNEMAVDTGYSFEKINELVKIGDLITIKREVIELQNGLLSGKSFDDKAGVASLLEGMKNLKDFNHSADIYFVATAQEEVGSGGAKTAAYNIKPDIGIAVDVTFAKMPGLSEYETFEMGKGAVIAVGPNIHYKIFETLKEVAKENNISYQIEVLPKMSHTDAMAIQVSGDGVATGLLSIPLKYMHTSVETVSIKDIVSVGKLISAFVISLNCCDLEVMLCS